MKYILSVGLIIVTLSSYAQKKCEINLIGLDQVYEGDCKKGLAHGTGTASGELGQYIGEFKKGFPDGKGKIIYVDGSIYNGEWKRGDREGYGEMLYPNDSSISGFWKENRYLGKYENEWELKQQRGTARYKLTQVSKGQNKIEIEFFRGGRENVSLITNLRLSASSGIQYNSPGYIGFEQVEYPLEVTINYLVPNQFNTSTRQEVATFVINAPGGWLIRANY